MHIYVVFLNQLACSESILVFYSPQGFLHPEWLHNEFTHLEFPRRLFRQDIGKDVLYRDAWMKGW